MHTFADVSLDPGGVGPAQRVRELVEEIELADEVGLDFYGVGEHHRPDFAASAPAMILAAAPRGPAHPADQRRHGAELGRPGAGLPAVRDAGPALHRPRRDHGRARLLHRVLPALRLRPRRLRRAVRGEARPAARRSARAAGHLVGPAPRRRCTPGVYPRPVQDPLPIWVAVGGTPKSVVRAGAARPAADARDHRRRAASGSCRWSSSTARPARRRARPEPLPVGITSTASSPRARRRPRTSSYPALREDDDRIGRERGWPPTDRAAVRRRRSRRTAPTAWARRSRWPRRSSSSTSCSGTTASCIQSRRQRAARRGACEPSSCWAPRWRHGFARRWPAARQWWPPRQADARPPPPRLSRTSPRTQPVRLAHPKRATRGARSERPCTRPGESRPSARVAGTPRVALLPARESPRPLSRTAPPRVASCVERPRGSRRPGYGRVSCDARGSDRQPGCWPWSPSRPRAARSPSRASGVATPAGVETTEAPVPAPPPGPRSGLDVDPLPDECLLNAAEFGDLWVPRCGRRCRVRFSATTDPAAPPASLWTARSRSP